MCHSLLVIAHCFIVSNFVRIKTKLSKFNIKQISLYWLMMVAILQLKASKLIVYFVSFTVVIFTIPNLTV